MRITEIKQACPKTHLPLPLFSTRVAAGFPSPADDYMEGNLDLNELLITQAASTFFVKVVGDSMQDAGIISGDLLIVDRSIKASHRNVVVAIVSGEFTVKRLLLQNKKIFLAAENPAYPLLEIKEGSDFEVWGVVTYVIHPMK